MNYKHGLFVQNADDTSGRRLYGVWASMKSRCRNTNDHAYDRYGARGINYDPAWEDFRVFVADMGFPPEGMTLERRNNNLGYSKANCLWASRQQQAQNRRSSRIIEWNGKRMVLAEWARHLGMRRETISRRLDRGWPVSKALTPLEV